MMTDKKLTRPAIIDAITELRGGIVSTHTESRQLILAEVLEGRCGHRQACSDVVISHSDTSCSVFAT
jgi:hypothetical protein